MRSWGADEWSAFGSVVTASIAVVAAVFAALQVREARDLRKAQAQPFVVVGLEQSTVLNTIVDLVITNVGPTLARDVKLTFDPAIDTVHERETGHALVDSPLFQIGLPSMPPGMRLARVFEDATKRDPGNDDLPWTYTVTVEFSDHTGKRQDPLEYVVDMLALTSGTYLEERGLHHVASELKQVRQTIDKWSEGSAGLRVWTRSGAERDAGERRYADKLRRLNAGETPPIRDRPWWRRWLRR